MTLPDEGHELGRVLAAAVPELVVPPDRLAEVRTRVRRTRGRMAVLAAACAVLVGIGVPVGLAGRGADPVPAADLPLAGKLGPQRGGCPAALPAGFSGTNDGLPATEPGVLAPAGAVRAVMCRYDPMLDGRAEFWPGPARELVLTAGVADLTAVLNRLPARSGIDPCFLLHQGGYLTLEYGGGPPVAIEFSSGCGFVRSGGITRHGGWDAILAFDELYRAQELASAAPVGEMPAADCPAALTPGEKPYYFAPDPVPDRWLYAPVWREGQPLPVPPTVYLPAPLAAVTACRYADGGDGVLSRIRRVTDRALADEVARAVEQAYQGEQGQLPFLGCPPDRRPGTVDVLMLRDVAGEVFEVRVGRDTCRPVVFGFDGAPESPALRAVIDRLLGEP